MRLLLLLVLLVGCIAPSQTPAVGAASAPARDVERVTRVLDGDTLEIGDERIRLKGLNAPESNECLGPEAGEALRRAVAAGVRVDRRGAGDHGRTLAYLFAGGTPIHVALVEQGLALAYPYGKRDDQTAAIAAAEARAREAGVGLFDGSACGPADPAAAALSIIRVVSNPPGDDLAFGAGEYVELSGPPGMSLAGWTLKDRSASNRYHFASGTSLPDSGRLRLYTACGPAAPDRLFWCRSRAGVWNNGGDTAWLLDPSGNTVSYMSYGGASGR